MSTDWEKLVNLARMVCMERHAGQCDKAGEPYYLHPFAVAERVGGDGAERCVAYLHDVVEDTDTTLEELSDMGFPDEVVDAVDAISRRDGEIYADFIDRCKDNPIACKVKLADLSHNMDPDRRTSLPESLRRRYEKALDTLMP